ncbi:hemin-degrading factor [Olivibacter sp. SDN3]|uniref:hemin-degrading factor n=1 Tax=Olivibacter sp. SDN3 TaxID=2764720 RepID=UPI00165150A0|nr:ChuX/HutX family heme-like substrate-binding protein [Olivibacter sp. SDN3]QNL51449.1 hemin-degrading factor [Olivibacter sp. SDN3]
MDSTKASLREKYNTFKTQHPKVRIRDAAKELGVTEAELVAVSTGTIQLRREIEEILKEVPSLGYVMALTRNDFAVHERKGEYRKVGVNGHVGLVVNPDIDLRLFLNAWKFAFSVNENGRKSLQFFGKDGEAVHKIYLQDQSNEEAYNQLVANFKAEDQEESLVIEDTPGKMDEKPDNEIDVDAFKAAWLALKDTHEFHGMLRKFGVTRTQAMRLAPDRHTHKIDLGVLKSILEAVSARSLEIMVFIGNKGCIQIHTGQAKRLLQTGPWFNVLDPEFNMHLREDAIENIWVVKKPTDDGHVTSIEAYDAAGDIIVQFFGKRKPGIPEREDWRKVIADSMNADQLLEA